MWFHITTVGWSERCKGLRRSSVVCAVQLLTVEFFQDPQFDPQVLADTIQRVTGQQESGEFKKHMRNSVVAHKDRDTSSPYTYGYVELKF